MVARTLDVSDEEASALVFLEPSPGKKRACNKRKDNYGGYENNRCHEII
jgi:hypothetical protein